MTPEQEHKIFTRIGYIHKGVKNLEIQVTKQNGDLAKVKEKVQRHEVFIGKVGMGMALVAFLITVGVNGIIAWFRFLK